MVRTRHAAAQAAQNASAHQGPHVPAITLAAPTSTTTSVSHPNTSIFRFLELSAELRNRIYLYAVLGSTGSNPLNLSNFKELAITAVSQQVRTESLPVMFAECTFDILVGSDLWARRQIRVKNDPRPQFRWNDQSKAGTLGVKRSVMKLIRTSKSAAVFRHVNFNICPAESVHRMRYLSHQHSEDVVAATLSLVYGSRELTTDVLKGLEPTVRRPWYPGPDFESVDLIVAVSDAAAVAKELAERDGFLGFTIKDLDRIAKGFRFIA
ncbi:hypothetical protein LTR36_007298 [Oleoguttula mirabilis]|uniref:Uncharacterized protein n=1 Tax=Oleoguttula mirabilis TaxID=1507867 RepID=A0AAV9J9Z0_9PEZI|nr:hypothetical protein LTR36_007298 [Oleoguttula mirabilis]